MEDKQVQGLQKFADSMQSAAKALFAVAFCELALSVYQVLASTCCAVLFLVQGRASNWKRDSATVSRPAPSHSRQTRRRTWVNSAV